MLHHNWDTFEREKHRIPYVHITRRPELCQSQEMLFWASGFYWDLKDLSWGGNQVRQRVYSREKAFIKSFSHVWEYKWEEQKCQDWTLNEYNLIGKTYANWTVNTRWNMISSVKEIRSSFSEHRRYFHLLGYQVKIHLNLGNLVSIATFALSCCISLDNWLNHSWIYLYILNMGGLPR